MIAGKIIPAIATTTASITGIVSLQLYTLLQTQKIEYMRNCFLNLAISLFVMTEPAEVIKMQDKAYPRQLMRRNTGEAFVSLTFTGSNDVHYEAKWSVARARKR